MTETRTEPIPGWRALSEGAAWVPLAELGALRVSGPDRFDFLNGQVSHDVRRLDADAARRVLLLDAKGHARAEATVLPSAEALLAFVEDGGAEALRAHLEAHVVFDQVEVAWEARHGASLTVQGPDADAAFRAAFGAAPPADQRHVVLWDGALRAVRRDRCGRGGVDLHPLGADPSAVRAALRRAGVAEAAPEALEAARIAAGVPRTGREAGAGVLPQSAGLEPLVSYRKGCYLGQEIMARLEARGTLKRHLSGLRLDGAPGADPGAPIRHGERAVGRLGGWAAHPELGPIALAVLRDDVPEDAELRVGTTRGRRTGLPFPGAAMLAP